jgi:hypothetical protein
MKEDDSTKEIAVFMFFVGVLSALVLVLLFSLIKVNILDRIGRNEQRLSEMSFNINCIKSELSEVVYRTVTGQR